MLYIKDYRNIKFYNAYATAFTNELSNLLGKTILVFTASGGVSGNGVSGLLLEFSTNYVTILINFLPALTEQNHLHLRKRRANEKRGITTKMIIPLCKIVAVSYQYT